jgi:hypothetical protein
MTHGREKSDPSIVAVKLANKTGRPEAESVERREGAEGNRESNASAGLRAGKACPRSLTAYEKRVVKEERNGSPHCSTM